MKPYDENVKLTLVRHGHAPSIDGHSPRSLSPQGIEEVSSLAIYLKREKLIPKKIIHSGILRAEQTATLLRDNLNPDLSLEQAENLKPESPLFHWSNLLLSLTEDLMLVGHMPYMGLMVEELSGEPIPFPTGHAVILERSTEGSWSIIKKSF